MKANTVKQLAKLILNRHVQVKPYYDLRTKLEDKYEDAKTFEGWTAFINKKGNLAHVLRNGQEYMMIRLCHLKLKGCADDYINKIVSQRLYEGLA
jgi:hypothetical protein